MYLIGKWNFFIKVQITIKNLTKILEKKHGEGDLKEFIMFVSAYDKENTPPEIRSILNGFQEAIQKQKEIVADFKRKGR